MGSVVKIGPWGSLSGNDNNMVVAPARLQSITIYSGDGVEHNAGPWGGAGGGIREIKLGPSEFVTEIKGTYGPYTYGPHGRVEGITNLSIVTNLKSYGPYGVGKLDTETSFSVPVKSGGSIVGFFAVTGTYYVNALGVYVKP
ncbi:hypothetical protein BS78_07G031400 [Paspalum vaginatum]|nr:hypothetical protein BS78_07G031400 [Paspalum vaginatum]